MLRLRAMLVVMVFAMAAMFRMAAVACMTTMGVASRLLQTGHCLP
jgi:hypothetical protein